MLQGSITLTDYEQLGAFIGRLQQYNATLEELKFAMIQDVEAANEYFAGANYDRFVDDWQTLSHRLAEFCAEAPEAIAYLITVHRICGDLLGLAARGH